MKFYVVVGIALLGGLSFLACGDGDSCTTNVSLSKCILPLFNDDNNGCTGAGCHSGATPNSDLDLSQNLHTNMVNVKAKDGTNVYIVPGKPEESYLLTKMKANPPAGGQMPIARTAFTTEQLTMIETWIKEGALDN